MLEKKVFYLLVYEVITRVGFKFNLVLYLYSQNVHEVITIVVFK